MKASTLLSLILFSSSAFAAESLQIGAIFPLTGTIATYGQENVNALKLFLDNVNAKNGVDGHPIELLVEDDHSEATDSINSINKLISVNQVKTIFGTPSSGNTLAIAPIANRNKITLLSPSGTSSKIPAVGNHIGHVCFSDDYQATVMANFAFNTLKSRKIAVFEDRTSDYSVGLTQAFKKQFAALGGQIVNDDLGYSSNDRDFRSLLIKAKKHNPDALYIPGYYTQAGMIINQARSLGLKAPILGADGFDSPILNSTAGKTTQDVYFSTHFSIEDSNPTVQEFVKSYKSRYGMVPGAQAALAYDAAGMVVEALKQCKYPCQDLSKNLFQIKNYKGVTGTISFDKDRNTLKDVVIIRVVDGKNTFFGRISP